MFGYKLVKEKDLIPIGNFKKAMEQQRLVIEDLEKMYAIVQVSDLQETVKSELWRLLIEANCGMLLTGMYLLPKEFSKSSKKDEA